MTAAHISSSTKLQHTLHLHGVVSKQPLWEDRLVVRHWSSFTTPVQTDRHDSALVASDLLQTYVAHTTIFVNLHTCLCCRLRLQQHKLPSL